MRSIQHHFVQYLPEILEPGTLYISLEYMTASHLCCCGCGEEVVTPFSPICWRMTFDGETITLWPSIGNWKLRCRSHYIIDRGRIIVAGPWTDEQIATERQRNNDARADNFGQLNMASLAPPKPVIQPEAPLQIGRLRKLWRWLFGGH